MNFVLFNYDSYGYVDIVLKFVNKKTDVNIKGENGEMLLYLACGNNHDSMESCQFYAWYSISYLLFSIL
jgi:hypothetical protein